MQMKNINNKSSQIIMNSSSSSSSLHGLDHHHDSNDEFLQQFLISSCTWPPPSSPEDIDNAPPPHHSFHHFDESSSFMTTPSKHHPNNNNNNIVTQHHHQQQQMILMSPSSNASVDSSGLVPLPLSLNASDLLETSHTNHNNNHHDLMIDGLVNGFSTGSLNPSSAAGGAHHLSNPNQHFHQPNFGGTAAANTINGLGAANETAGGGQPSQQPRQRIRARRGQATDPHSIAERLRRERIAERMKALQELVPNANKTDKASMLDEIIDYVKFLQLQVKVLSMSRLGGAPPVSPLVPPAERGTNNTTCANDTNSMSVTEHQVAKLMEEDMGSAMQYLQGKGLCLMPISLATAISTATSHSRTTIHFPNRSNNGGGGGGGGEGPSSPNISALTVQSSGATMGGNNNNASVVDGPIVVKDTTNSISKP